MASSEDREVTKVTGTHEQGKTNSDVDTIYSDKNSLNFFPRNLEKFFNNLKTVYITASNISTLTKDDLQSLGGQLEKLLLFHNGKLEVLVADVFDYSPNLKQIDLIFNAIKYVERGTFGKLQKLTYLRFYANTCHNSDSFNDVVNLIADIERKCTNVEALERYKKIISSTTEEHGSERHSDELNNKNIKFSEECQQKFNEYEAKIAKLNTEIDNVKAENRKLQLKAEKEENIMNRISQMEASLKAELKDSKIELSSNLEEKFVFINASCSVFDHKLDLFSQECCSNKQP